MKTVVWIIFSCLLLLWTLFAWGAAEIAQWTSQFVSSGAAASAVSAAASHSSQALSQLPPLPALPPLPPTPEWLNAWLDPATLKAWQETARNMATSSTQAGSFLGGVISWLVPLVWVVWAVVALLMLIVTFIAQALIGRFTVAKQ